jgi:transglutaminase-like putative cysteine protease
MRIRISHEITHRFAPPARMLVQNVRLTPCGFDSQYVLGWRINVDIDSSLRQTEDAHGNILSSFSHHGAPLERVTVTARGEVETSDATGVVRGAIERLPPQMYLRESPLAHANGALRAFAAEATAGATDSLDTLHRLMTTLHETMAFAPRKDDGPDSAAEAFALRRGDARDFAHVFIACARRLQFPARYIAGYCAPREADGEEGAQPGAHAWAEAYTAGLGWIGFDASANLCPDDAYVRVVVGFDGQDAAFARSAAGGVEDKIDSKVWIDQAGYQTQA